MKPITDYKYRPELLTEKAFWWNCRMKEDFNGHVDDVGSAFNPLLSIVQNNAKLFTMICTTVPTMDGWTSIPKACALASLVLAIKPENVVEIGIWAGRSLIPMALALKSVGRGVITGIDPYSPQESAKNEFGENENWWAAQDHKAIKEKFLQFVTRFDLSKQVRHIESPSDKVKMKEPIQLLHVDGSHTEQAVRDAENFGPLVPIGGIAVLDDLNWVGGGVLRAIDCLEEQGFVERERPTIDGDNWNIMQRVK